MDRRCAALLLAGVLLRLFLFVAFPSLSSLLTDRVEISTPVTGFKRLQEGLFLYTHGFSPYDGGVFHQAPLLLAFFTALPKSPFATNVIYTLADALSALALIDISSSGVSAAQSARKGSQCPPWIVAASFLFNPFTIATCLGRSTIIFTNTAILIAISKAIRGKPTLAILALSLASYLNLYPVLLLCPLILLSYDSIQTPFKPKLTLYFFLQTTNFIILTSGLLCLSYLLTSSWEFLSSTYGVHLLLPDLTPNTGLWWYFFIEMFDSFRSFFLCVFQLHVLIYVFGITIRLRKQPLFVIITIHGISSIFKSYPSVGDMALYMSLLCLYRHVFPLMRYTFVAVNASLYATLLGPAFYHLWVYAGSGNANFFYAITLVWSLSMTVVVSDALFAVLRDQWETWERPEMGGKQVVQI